MILSSHNGAVNDPFDILDDLFLGCALTAFLEVAA